ncbi:hypothetical protein AX766_07350 [Flavobacterium covae]|uniref:DUF58 domain-containing protein n=2 Tax=Flavobacterium TaxID=237 RepID=A0AA94F570_9FLAO|nr:MULTISPECIES: DUF58 domain-containing protein [Flavobacterium]OXA82823.1 hypothetical protein B0A56_03690 [Flavobacterium columnare NBRC 100251 = ATCC 23463]AND64240.1 hypothetical protein AX766_07350 [Flavobacterium covae]MCH4828289.1 DUF58 domain-containing protein [Flavobacterium columnare]MCH4834236.1 DUF58 domain-containing protein [Flavobacterium columnare]OWP81809.1 hypothetical protein BWK63_03890 [Flavobacterium covae]
MNLESQIKTISSFQHLELLANQIVEGFISGMHKSPFHGFSAEFAEHKIYNSGESTKHIDWKLYAKTDRLYTKRYEEETNLRCHLIVDNSSSMYYPLLKKEQMFYENKIGFSVLASAVLMNLLKRQRDAVGLSIYSDHYEYYAPEKGSERHHRMLLNQLDKLLKDKPAYKKTDTITYLHQIAEKLHKRSMVILFTDMFQLEDEERLFKALQHLKYNKHKVVVFHVVDYKTEFNLHFDNQPRKFVDLETNEEVNLFGDGLSSRYQEMMTSYFERIANTCSLYKIKYVPVSIEGKFEKIMTSYLIEKQGFI